MEIESGSTRLHSVENLLRKDTMDLSIRQKSEWKTVAVTTVYTEPATLPAARFRVYSFLCTMYCKPGRKFMTVLKHDMHSICVNVSATEWTFWSPSRFILSSNTPKPSCSRNSSSHSLENSQQKGKGNCLHNLLPWCDVIRRLHTFFTSVSFTLHTLFTQPVFMQPDCPNVNFLMSDHEFQKSKSSHQSKHN